MNDVQATVILGVDNALKAYGLPSWTRLVEVIKEVNEGVEPGRIKGMTNAVIFLANGCELDAKGGQS